MEIASQIVFSEELHEECSVFGVNDKDGIWLSDVCDNGLLSLQHRGQERCGISVDDRGVLSSCEGSGVVSEQFNKEFSDSLDGQTAIARQVFNGRRQCA